MINRLTFVFFLLASSAAAQGVRFSSTVTQQGTVGTSTNVVVLPAAPVVKFCAHPANAVPCSNLATTYTDQTLATPCAGATQIVRDGTNTCVASPDAQNNWGVWVAPNSAGYDYTITLTGGVNLGPFNVLSQTTTISAITGPLTVSGGLTSSGTTTLATLNDSGPATFTGALNANGGITVPLGQTAAINGVLNASGGGTETFSVVNKRVYVDQIAGADVGAKCNAATTALGVGGGVLDFTGFQGAQTWTTTCNGQSNTTYQFPPAGAATFTMSGVTFGLNFSGTNNAKVLGGSFALSGDGLASTNAGLAAITFQGTGTSNEATGVTVTGDTLPPTVFTILTVQRATNVITVTYTGNANLIVGQLVSITGVTFANDITLNVEAPVASQSAGTFTIANTGSNSGPFAQGVFTFFPKYALSTVQRASNVVTATYAGNANLSVGQGVILQDISSDTTLWNYCQILTQSAGNFTCTQSGANSGPFSSQGNFQLANQQYGIRFTNIQTDARLINNIVSNVTWALACGTSGVDTMLGCLAQGNTVHDIPGHGTGSGYGFAGQNGGNGRYRIVNNSFTCLGRHAIYTGAGAGHEIIGNHIFNHGCGVPANDGMAVGRQADATIVGNTWDTTYGTALDLFAGATPGTAGQVAMRNITVTANNFKDTFYLNHDILIQAENSANDVPRDVIISKNVTRRTGVGTAATAAAFVETIVGQRIDIDDNTISYDGVAASGRGISSECTGDSGGTATFSDRIHITNNKIRTNGSGDVGIYFSSSCATSNVLFDVKDNHIDTSSSSAVFWSGGSITDQSTMFCNNTATFGNNPLGNTPANTSLFSCASNKATFTGSARAQQHISDQGAVCTNGELALSAGWQSTGSATVTGVAGNGQTCSWTITTGTTTAANPTVTDTLTNALPAATTRCWMFLEYGPASTHTAAAGEGFAQTTLSATAPIFTFNGTPTAAGKTYLLVRTCGP